MNMVKIICLPVFLFFIVSCSEYEKMMEPAVKAKLADKNPKPVFDGEVEPPIPSRSENDSSIMGVDANNNDIRDDIDIWINRTGFDYNERMAMRQYAKAQQYWLKVCTENLINDVMKAENESVNSRSCLSAVTDHRFGKIDFLANKIDYLTLNIGKRNCEGFYNKHSTVITIKNTSNRHLNCKFNVQNLSKVIDAYGKFLGSMK